MKYLTAIALVLVIACTPTTEQIEPVEQDLASEPDVVIDMVARNWEFKPSEVRVKNGDLVRINVRSEDAGHGLAIEGYDQSVKFDAGGSATLEFVADKSGEFRLYCNVFCGQGHREMAGKLIVE
jgi:cytochrome c oxidase subunit 2